jgi:hypothetical protein
VSKKETNIWFRNFKIAVLNIDIDSIRGLIDDMPSFDDEHIDIKKEVLIYLSQANSILKDKNSILSDNMKKIRLKQQFNKTLYNSQANIVDYYV